MSERAGPHVCPWACACVYELGSCVLCPPGFADARVLVSGAEHIFERECM